MRTITRHLERHRGTRIGWLRAAVLGANDGLVSPASLVLGVAVAGVAHAAVLMTAWAGLIAGAMSMAAGEYISVYSQRDTENAELDRERLELERDPRGELGRPGDGRDQRHRLAVWRRGVTVDSGICTALNPARAAPPPAMNELRGLPG